MSVAVIIRFTEVPHEDGGPAIVVAVMRGPESVQVRLSRHYTLEALGRVLEPRR